MSFRNSLRPAVALSVAGALAFAGQLSAAWKVGEGAEVFLTADGSIEANDNIFLTASSTESDTIVGLSPGAFLTFGENAITQGELGFKEDFKFYSSNSDINSSLAHAWFNLNRGEPNVRTKADVSFNQFDQANVDVRGAGFLVRRDIFHAGIRTDVDITPKSVVGAGIAYDRTEYKRAGYVDWKWWQIPVAYYFKTTPKLELGAGLTYRNNELSTTRADSTEFFYSVRARGEVTPKLTTEIGVGLLNRHADFGGNQNTLGIEGQATYTATEKTYLVFGASNGYGYSGTGSSYRKFSLNGGVDITFSNQLRGGANFSYGRYSYTGTGQKDDFYNGDLHGSYQINAFWSLNASYNYARNDSNLVGSGFTQNRWVFGASLKY